MDTTQKTIITLIKCAVMNERLDLPNNFDFEEVYSLAQKHSIEALIYDGAVRCGIEKNGQTMSKLLGKYCRMMLINEGQLQQIERIFHAFDEHGIHYMPLKGCTLKALYPKPELRTMGDADILIRLDQYVQIQSLMASLDFSAVKESDHELVWKNNKLYVELHKRLIPSYNKDFYAYFGDGWQLATQCEGTHYSMSAEDEFIYLFTHFAKHFRDGGIGCRHVLDLWIYLRANADMDEARIRAVMKELQLLEFYENIRRMIRVWFENQPADEKSVYMTDFIFESGSWGNHENRAASVNIRNTKHIDRRVSKRFYYIWTRFFPTVETIQYEYPILQKTRSILPVVWIARLFRKVFLERGAVKRKLREISALTPENIQNHHQAMQYLGLDYHF